MLRELILSVRSRLFVEGTRLSRPWRRCVDSMVLGLTRRGVATARWRAATTLVCFRKLVVRKLDWVDRWKGLLVGKGCEETVGSCGRESEARGTGWACWIDRSNLLPKTSGVWQA